MLLDFAKDAKERGEPEMARHYIRLANRPAWVLERECNMLMVACS